MITDSIFSKANVTNFEVGMHRSMQAPYMGDGSSAEMSPPQVKGWASRILVASETSDLGYLRLIIDRGLSGRAAEQVLRALEAE